MLRPFRTARAATGLVAALAAVLAAGCGGGDAPRVDVTLSLDMPATVPLGEPLHMTYTWTAGGEFQPPAEDYKVFVHARGPQGNILVQDDHYPAEPTSQWSVGDTHTYERWLYMPDGVEVERLDFAVGFYSPDGRALVRGDAGTWIEEIPAHSLEIRVDDMSGVPVYMDGWHSEEGNDERSWRWTEGTARVVFTNPRRDGVLHLSAHGPYDEVGAQELVLRIGEAEIARLPIDSAADFSERIEIPATAMGDDDWVELTLETTPVFVPQDLDPESADERTLGVQVFRLYLSSS